MPARLTVYYPNRPARRFSLEAERRYVIGRGTASDLRLDDRRLSRRHATLERDGDAWCLTDLDSKNGVLVDGRPVNRIELSNGSWISFGGLVASFGLLSEQVRRAEEKQAEHRWEHSIELSRTLDPTVGLDVLLQRALASVLELADADRGFVVLNRPSQGELRVMAQRVGNEAVPSENVRFPGSSSAVEIALTEQKPVVTCDAGLDTLLSGRPSVVSQEIRALVCLPLKVGDQAIGAIYVDSRRPGKVFTELDVEMLEALATHAALVIGVACLSDDIAGLAEMLPVEMSRKSASDSQLVRMLRRRLPGARRFPVKANDDVSEEGTISSPTLKGAAGIKSEGAR